jgi:two-component system response regulator CpxR
VKLAEEIMPIITVFSGKFCNAQTVVDEVCQRTDYRRFGDGELVDLAAGSSGMAADKIWRAFSSKVPVFNAFTRERERAVRHLRLAVAETLMSDNLLIDGLCALLVPLRLQHALRVCLIADRETRVVAARGEGRTEAEALQQVQRDDVERAQWAQRAVGSADPWAAEHYDMLLPTDKLGLNEAAALIAGHADSPALMRTSRTEQTVADLLLRARVEVELEREGHVVDVETTGGAVTLTINHHVLLLRRLEDELTSIVERVSGVSSVRTVVGGEFHQADIYRKVDLDMPSKLLLVDDEREFVQTLSERLSMRELDSVIAYDGASALDLVSEDEPDVMILDLRMPGVDGIEVLRRVKATSPDVEVIILTGHGSEADRETCMQLGAFAYLHKPVNIDDLGKTIEQAKEVIRKKRAQAGD